MSNENLNKIVTLLARHKLIPFLGAGVSIGHLASWNELTKKIAEEADIGCDGKNNESVFEEYVKVNGRKALEQFLIQNLTALEYNEEKNSILTLIVSWGIGVIYSTNPDNLFELCIKKYGRNYKSIVAIDDIRECAPGDLQYVKYHGDITNPETIVFAKSDYDHRIGNKDHFLNIKMKSDILCKGFLFIGYSFRDPNIRLLFEELRSIFGKKIPESYLITYEDSPEMNKIGEDFGINIISPKLITGESDSGKAFEILLSKINYEVCIQKTNKEIGDLFSPKVSVSSRVITKWDIDAIENLIKSGHEISDTISKFRAYFDTALVPEELGNRVVKIFIDLAQSCTNKNHGEALKNAALHLRLKNIDDNFTILSAIITTFRFCDGEEFSINTPHIYNFKHLERFIPIAILKAANMLETWEIKINDGFINGSFQLFIGHYNEDELDEKDRRVIEGGINNIWQKYKTPRENPVLYYKKNKNFLQTTSKIGKPFSDIKESLLSSLPKEFKKPHEY